jgi:CDP-diacylglycerol---glycerol-3-phosphate 3-phosphatidyltransferase
VVLRYGVMPASRGGKLKTVLQAGALLLMLAPLTALLGDWYPWAGWTVMGAALAVTLVTGADYVLKAVRLRRTGLAGGARP